MIVDTSALVALIRSESRAADVMKALDDHPQRLIAAPTVLELSIVMGQARASDIDSILGILGLTIVECGVDELRCAREGLRRYGRGSGSPARLNFGDCLVYGAAKAAGLPLLFIGDDFTHTDVQSVLVDPSPRL